MKQLFLLGLALLLLNCGDNNPQPTKKNEPDSVEVEKLLMQDYWDATFLLSHKYEIDSAIATQITNEYIKVYDPILLMVLNEEFNDKIEEKVYNPAEEIPEFISRLNLQTGIPIQKLSGYIVDLKLYMKDKE